MDTETQLAFAEYRRFLIAEQRLEGRRERLLEMLEELTPEQLNDYTRETEALRKRLGLT